MNNPFVKKLDIAQEKAEKAVKFSNELANYMGLTYTQVIDAYNYNIEWTMLSYNLSVQKHVIGNLTLYLLGVYTPHFDVNYKLHVPDAEVQDLIFNEIKEVFLYEGL